jgi:hypothetical protein
MFFISPSGWQHGLGHGMLPARHQRLGLLARQRGHEAALGLPQVRQLVLLAYTPLARPAR